MCIQAPLSITARPNHLCSRLYAVGRDDSVVITLGSV